MKAIGVIGAILVIAGFVAFTEPILAGENGLHPNRHRSATNVEQYSGAVGMLIGLGLVGLDVTLRH
jgi:hypothetical protein